MWALLLFMVPSRQRLLPRSGRGRPGPGDPERPGRQQRPAPDSTKSRLLHLSPPQSVAKTPRAPNSGSRSPARPGAPPGTGAEGRGAETGERGGAGAFYTRGAGVALSAGRRPGWRRSLGSLFSILAWVARCGAPPRDGRRGPFGKGGTALLLLGLPLSRVPPACRAQTPAALPYHQLPLS